MLITRKSAFTGIERTLDIPVLPEQMALWENGMLIQNAMPQLSADQREFILTGFTAEEWEDAFGEAE
mgnify:CR=1 FL=1